MIAIGKHYVFDTHGLDSELNGRSGAICTVDRPLTFKEADLFETGPMYSVVFEDGYVTDVFEDELLEV